MKMRWIAEFIGTFTLVAVVVGSGSMAESISNDIGVQLLINAVSTVLALGILIFTFGPISGAHFNPVVTLIEFLRHRITPKELFGFLLAQFTGGIAGAIVANLMFGHSAYFPSTHIRNGWNLWLGEIFATAGLIALITFLQARPSSQAAPVVIASWIGSAYFFTSSTSFANPAVTLARSLTDTFSGIDLSSVPMFMLAQCAGALIGAMCGNYFTSLKQEDSDGR
jgi:glycerol uptake facilitator-like aquaporin